MEEDEDVILEGTSLHEHLKNVGFTDYEVISSHTKTSSMMKDIHPVKPDQNKKCEKIGIYSHLMKKISVIFKWSALEKWMLDSMCLRVTQAKVLEEEDLLILETLSPAMKSLSSLLLQDYNTSIEEFQMSFVPCSFPILYFWVVLSALLSMVNFVCEMCFIHYLFLTFLVGAIIGVLVVFVRIFILNKYKRNLQKFIELIKMIQNSNQLSSRCFRFFNEINIIRKGIGPKCTEIDLLECRYEMSLYEGLLSLLDSLTRHFQEAQCHLRQMNLKNAQSIHSLFLRRYEEEILQNNTDGEDNFVVCKDKRNEILFLSSAFLTEFLLCFELCGKLSLFKIISSENLKSVQKEIESLEKILNLSKKVWLRKEPDLKCLTNPPKSYERLKLDVSGVVDVLSVKCRVLAYSCVQLEEFVANYESKIDKSSFDAVQECCDEIKNKILSCNASLEDVVERTENLFDVSSGNSKSNAGTNENMEEKSSSNSSEEPTPVVVLKNIEPPVIEDEVFEAFADHKYHSLEEDKMMFESLKKERQLKKKQKERCKRVLQEIQPILQERRKMWEERETKAINRRKGKQKEQSSPSEISYSVDSGISSPVDCFVPDSIGNQNEHLLISQVTANSDLKQNKIGRENDVIFSQRDYESGEYDSEEERLLIYKRVRKELDDDEARRKNEDDYEDSEGEDFQREYVINTKSSLTLPLGALANINKSDLTGNNSFISGGISEKDAKSLACHDSENEDITLKSLHNVNSSLLISHVSAFKVDSLSGGKQESSVIVPDTVISLSGCKYNIPKNIPDSDDLISGINSTLKQVSPDNAPDIDDNYSCGESSDEYDKVLDWSSCGFERRRLQDEDDGRVIIPFAGVSTLLSGALKRPPRVGEEEVFGGVGEGESDEMASSEDESQPS